MIPASQPAFRPALRDLCELYLEFSEESRRRQELLAERAFRASRDSRRRVVQKSSHLHVLHVNLPQDIQRFRRRANKPVDRGERKYQRGVVRRVRQRDGQRSGGGEEREDGVLVVTLLFVHLCFTTNAKEARCAYTSMGV